MKKGFTLIELLVVVLIIGILAGIALPQYQRSVAKARATEALIALKAITDAQEVYYLTYDAYTPSLGDLDIKVDLGRNYSYGCSTEGYCTASPSGDYPVIQFYMSQPTGASKDYAGKHWCVVSGASQVASAVCKSFGPEDTSMPAGQYYLIGAINS